jgi:hypothetical protein
MLSLSDYLLLTVFAENVKLTEGRRYWTSTTLIAAANEDFFEIMKEKGR